MPIQINIICKRYISTSVSILIPNYQKKPKMHAHFFLLFITLIFVGFNGHFSILAADEIFLMRHNMDNTKILARYTDNIRSDDYEYFLNHEVDKELSMQAYNYGRADTQYSLLGNLCTQSEKSHLLANRFSIYQYEDDAVVNKYHPLTTKDFLGVPHIPKGGTKRRIDWTSEQSNLNSLNDNEIEIFHHQSGWGHSEPQFIKDILWLWENDKPSFLKILLPSEITQQKNPTVMMIGFELYGNFDICDKCLEELAAFKREYQQVMSQAIKKKLEENNIRYTDKLENLFVLIYHAASSYQASTYYTGYKNKEYKITKHSTTVHNSTKQKNYTHQAFALAKEDQNDKNDKFLKEAILSQATHLDMKKDIIYGHIHDLSNKKAGYKDKQPLYENGTPQFIF